VATGTARTVFARTHGWYEIHLHDLGAPETANLARLTNEPGYAVRRALEDLLQFRRTRRMPYAGTFPTASAGAGRLEDHREAAR